MIHIVLVEPEIPQNTGNIARTCAATGMQLHLIEPLGFSVEDRYLKRSGLDYWDELQVKYYKNFSQLREIYKEEPFYFATTKAKQNYAQIQYPKDVFFVFGKESAGLPEELLVQNKKNCIRIPMRESLRSLNLSNAVAIVSYEALRQQNFLGLSEEGNLAKLSWDT